MVKNVEVLSAQSESSIGLPIGWMLLILGLCLVLPWAIAYSLEECVIEPFLLASFLCLFCGGLLVTSFYHKKNVSFSLRKGFILTISSWCVLSFFASLPFFLFSSHSLTDALFEAVSALTTTGLSVLKSDYCASESMRFWRIFLQWVGGFGIMLMAVTLLPALKTGGAQLMMSEFSDRSEKMCPRSSQMTGFLMALYIALTLILSVFMMMGPISKLDGLYYVMASISTGGIMIGKDPITVLSAYHKSILIIAMLFGGSTFSLMFAVLYNRRSLRCYFQDDQTRGYVHWLIGICIATIVWTGGHNIINALFMAISAVTTTGFALGAPYDGFLSLLFLIASFVGGCSGSTAGGIKIFRLQILYRITKNQIHGMLKPYGYFKTSYNQQSLSEKTLMALITVVFSYVIGWFILALGFTLWGYALGDAMPLSASLITNSGLYLGPLTHKIAHLSEPAKYLAILGMLCGRFELITLLAVLAMPFLRR